MLKCAEEMHRNALYAALQVPEEARFWSEEDLEAFFDSNGSLVALGRKAPALSTKPQNPQITEFDVPNQFQSLASWFKITEFHANYRHSSGVLIGVLHFPVVFCCVH